MPDSRSVIVIRTYLASVLNVSSIIWSVLFETPSFACFAGFPDFSLSELTGFPAAIFTFEKFFLLNTIAGSV